MRPEVVRRRHAVTRATVAQYRAAPRRCRTRRIILQLLVAIVLVALIALCSNRHDAFCASWRLLLLPLAIVHPRRHGTAQIHTWQILVHLIITAVTKSDSVIGVRGRWSGCCSGTLRLSARVSVRAVWAGRQAIEVNP